MTSQCPTGLPDVGRNWRPRDVVAALSAMFDNERRMHRVLVGSALLRLSSGLLALVTRWPGIARWLWIAGTVPVVLGLAAGIARDLRHGRMGVDAIALLSMSAALGLGEPLAGAVVALMYAGGNLLEDFAVGRAERNLRSLVDRAPRVTHRRVKNEIADIPVDQAAVGDIVLVRSGEVVPLDGIVVATGSGDALIDMSALTGEPIPVARRDGDSVLSGTTNVGDTFELRATATAGDSAYAGIVRMVTAAQTAKSPFMRLADRYALLLLPLTVVLAGGAWVASGDPIRALAVLVAATPCPLILAAPVAFIAGVAQAAGKGILFKGSGPLETLAQTHTVMFDKTGTLTVGGARLVAIETAPGVDADEVLRLAASVEQASHHVVALAIIEAAKAKGLALTTPVDARETHGAGLEATIDGERLRVGSYQLVCGKQHPVAWAARALRRSQWRSALCVFVAVDDRAIGALLLGDEIRRETPRTVQLLRAAGVRRIVMVTGDRAEAAETIAAALDLDAVLANRDPADKVEAVVSEQRRHATVMVGDGINDAPALAAAGVGIAMGARGASAASEAADVVILLDRLDRIADAIILARRTRHIALESILAGMTLSGIAMILAAIGWLTPVAGALTQEVIDVAVILNALRALAPVRRWRRRSMPSGAARDLQQGHQRLEGPLNRLRTIADDLDDATAERAVALMREAQDIVSRHIVDHERADETIVYPQLKRYLADGHGLDAMNRAHREIAHLARLLERATSGLTPEATDPLLVRDAQRIIESIEALVRLHSAQEDDIFAYAAR